MRCEKSGGWALPSWPAWSDLFAPKVRLSSRRPSNPSARACRSICRASAGVHAWTLKAPDATLRDAKGNVIGKHFAGPSWQANDGSQVVGEPLNVSPSPNPGAIPWLVLRAISHTGAGEMAGVGYIVRTRTEGGVAPASGCDASHVNAEVRVPYGAIYLFFRG